MLNLLLFSLALAGARADEAAPPMQGHHHHHGASAEHASSDGASLMLHGNIFGTRIWQQGPRGRNDWAAPSMIMGTLAVPVAETHRLEVELMLTVDKWTFPDRGYPLFLQVGEADQNGVPFIDAQHPHSSPIMGLTFSDTLSLGGEDSLKLFFAPRGEATDGPIAFMHRVTGMANPDAPLGHHTGQDVSHITSTVIGAGLQLDTTRVEASVYNGTEPLPEKVDLPLGTPNSFSVRLTQEFTPKFSGMISAARVKELEDASDFQGRYSASLYLEHPLWTDWTASHALIFGMISPHHGHGSQLSFLKEVLLRRDPHRIFGRIELLQRTPEDLAISASDPEHNHWVAALTLGYSHRLLSWEGAELGIGGSVTKDLLPEVFQGAYGGNPWTGKVFLQLSGMRSFDL